MGLLSGLSAMNPIVAALGATAIETISGTSREAGQMMDATQYRMGDAKERAEEIAEKAQIQAQQSPKYTAKPATKVDMDAFVRQAVLPAYRDAPQFVKHLMTQLKKANMPSSVLKQVQDDFSWTEKTEGKRVK